MTLLSRYGSKSRRKYGRRKNAAIKYKNLDETAKIILIMLFVFLFFVCIGSFIANKWGSAKYSGLFDYVDRFSESSNLSGGGESIERNEVFKECLLKYGKSIVLIWILSFIPIGGIFAFIILGIKGMSIGFTTSIFIINYGLSGLKYSVVMYMPQSILMVSAYFFVTCYSIKYILKNINDAKGSGVSVKRDGGNGIFEHFIILVLGLGFVVMASAFESYILPSVMIIFLLS